MSDEPFKSYSTFFHLLALCLILSSSEKTPTSSQSEKYTISFLARSFSSVSIEVPPYDKYFFQLHTKIFLSRPLYETYYFLSAPFSHPIMSAPSVVQVLCHMTHTFISRPFYEKHMIQLQMTTNISSKQKILTNQKKNVVNWI